MNTLSSPTKSFDEVTDHLDAAAAAAAAPSLVSTMEDRPEDRRRAAPPQSRDCRRRRQPLQDDDDEEAGEPYEEEEEEEEVRYEEQVKGGESERPAAMPALPAPTYPVVGAVGSNHRVAMARYDSFGMDDDDDDDDVEEEEEDGHHPSHARRRRRRRRHRHRGGRSGHGMHDDEDVDDDDDEDDDEDDDDDSRDYGDYDVDVDDYRPHYDGDEDDDRAFDSSHSSLSASSSTAPSPFASTAPSVPRTRSFRPFQTPSDVSATVHDTADDAATGNDAALASVVGRPLLRLPSVDFPSLPQDALHAIAAFSTPGDFSRLSSSCRASHSACRDVFRRVWRHAFRCVQEVCLAWAAGEHGDARELAALYLERGVPLYPLPRGLGEERAHGTIEWRMGLETKESLAGGGPSASSVSSAAMEVDPFYRHRFESSLGERRTFPRRNVRLQPPRPRQWRDDRRDHHRGFVPPAAAAAGWNDAFRDVRDVRDLDADDSDWDLPSPPPPACFLTYAEEKALFWKARRGVPVARTPVPTSVPPPPPPMVAAEGRWPDPRDAHGNADIGPMRESRRHSLPHNVGEGWFSANALRRGWRDRDDHDDDHDHDDNHDNDDVHHHPDDDDVDPLDRIRRRNSLGRTAAPTARAGPTTTTAIGTRPETAATMTLRIHKHLADQHLFGLPSVHDPRGSLLVADDDHDRRRGRGAASSRVSLDVDFFHPQWSGAVARRGKRRELELDREMELDLVMELELERERRQLSRGPAIDVDGDVDIRRILRDAVMARARPSAAAAASSSTGQRPLRRSAGRRHSVETAPRHGTFPDASAVPRNATRNSTRRASPASDVRLDLYGAANPPSFPPDDPRHRAVARARVRCAHRHRLAETLLADYDLPALRECLLDLWDDLFPATAGIHYHDGRAPVPRASSLHEFLTRPCPRVLGTMQCEIVRVKTTSKPKKGVNVKGRFFPTYEYRLFLRDPGVDADGAGVASSRRRRDAVLMVAKTGGKRRRRRREGRVEDTTTATTSSSRGVTNYYLCLPQQRDVDVHFRTSNASGSADADVVLPPGEKSGLAVSPLAEKSNAPVEVGRLQSNFIGTEFQIFSPSALEPQPPPSKPRDDFDGHGSRPSEDDENENDENENDESGGTGGAAVAESPPPRIAATGTATSTATAPTSNSNPHPNRPAPSRRASMDAIIPPALHSKARRRGSGLVRLARRASLTMTRRASMTNHHRNPNHVDDPANASTSAPANAVDDPTSSSPQDDKRPNRVTRRMSWGPSFPTGVKKANRNRRAIANAAAGHGQSKEGESSSPWGIPVGEEECGAITYTANLLGNRPRIMDVCIPVVGEDGRPSAEWRRTAGGGGGGVGRGGDGIAAGESGNDHFQAGHGNMLTRFKAIQQRWEETPPANERVDVPADTHTATTAAATASERRPHPDERGLVILQNRPPWWNMELGAFVLNFGGRVSVASVKNFQLCERGNVDAPTLVQFGRIQGRHSFTMDFQYPMTPVQAFAIAISSLQSKISFG